MTKNYSKDTITCNVCNATGSLLKDDDWIEVKLVDGSWVERFDCCPKCYDDVLAFLTQGSEKWEKHPR